MASDSSGLLMFGVHDRYNSILISCINKNKSKNVIEQN